MHNLAENLLEGSTALVTGCGKQRGIGRAIATTLAGLGADVVVTDMVPTGRSNLDLATSADAGWEGIDSVAAEIMALGRTCVALTADISLESDVEALFEQAERELGPIDILVNNAAAPHGADRAMFWEVPIEAFDELMKVDLRAVFLTSKAFARRAVARGAAGAIVNIASAAGKRGHERRVVYCAAKAGVIRMTDAMSLELARHSIRVNAVCPGPIQTDRLLDTHAKFAAGHEPDEHTAIMTTTPLGILGVPRDIANAVAFLASPAASFITGQALSVDGGSVRG